LLTVLKHIWFASDQICSKKLKAAIPLWLPLYETVYKTLSPEAQDRLLSISAATIDRMLKPVRVAYGRKGLSGTWNKGAEGALVQIKDIEASLPFDMQGFDCDNGSEFLNYHLVRYFTDHPSVT